MTALFSADEEMTTREPPAFAQFDAACDFETAFEKYTYGGGLGGGKGGGKGGGDGGGGNGCSGGANGDGSLWSTDSQESGILKACHGLQEVAPGSGGGSGGGDGGELHIVLLDVPSQSPPSHP